MLRSDRISVQFAPPCCGTGSTASGLNFTVPGDLQAFAVSGVDIVAPFDPNPALPATAILNCLPTPPFGSGCASQPSVTISISNRSNLVYGVLALGLFGCGNPNATNVGAGFSLIQVGVCSAIEYQTVSGRSLSNLKVGFTLSSNQTNEWSMIADAVQGPPIHGCATNDLLLLATADSLKSRICP